MQNNIDTLNNAKRCGKSELLLFSVVFWYHFCFHSCESGNDKH